MESPKEFSFGSDLSSANLNSSYHDYSFNGLPLTKLNVNSYLFFSSNLNSIATHQKNLLKKNQMKANSLNHGNEVNSIDSLSNSLQEDRMSIINEYFLNSTPLKVSTDHQNFTEEYRNISENTHNINNGLLMITTHRSPSKGLV